MTDTPDVVVDHVPVACGGCGADLAEAAVSGEQRRQVIDLPAVTPEMTEHRAQTRVCACCGAATTAAFPDTVRASVSYGPRVRAVVTYLLARQHIPVERCAEAMRDLFGVNISTGTVDAIYTDAARRLRRFITALVALLRTLKVVHADETTDRVSASGEPRFALGDPDVDRYLEFVAGRCRPNTVRAVAFDLEVFSA